ncbi:MAG: hypothetical protein HKN80_01320 [Acidimicrobiia bacterium]|nr:hypothetical protein [Acidimicrobiia bacterium]
MCTKECGQLSPPDEQKLIEAFQIVAQDAFAFLTREHELGAAPLATFDLDRARQRTPVATGDVEYPFLAVIEFTGANPPVRLSYGEREYHLDLEIGANGSGYHPLGSWLDALGIASEAADDSGVATPTALARHARRLARGLRDHFEAIQAATPDVLSRLSAQGARTPARLNRTRDRAHAAFAVGDYASYVELLGPFEDALTVTERRKLDFARGKSAALRPSVGRREAANRQQR